jgi:hypothetical protein
VAQALCQHQYFCTHPKAFIHVWKRVQKPWMYGQQHSFRRLELLSDASYIEGVSGGRWRENSFGIFLLK